MEILKNRFAVIGIGAVADAFMWAAVVWGSLPVTLAAIFTTIFLAVVVGVLVWPRGAWRREWNELLLVSSLVLVVCSGGFFLSGVVFRATRDIERELVNARDSVKELPLASDFYRHIPGTADLMVRNIRVDTKGATPPIFFQDGQHKYVLRLTEMKPADNADVMESTFGIGGFVGTNEITGWAREPIKIRQGEVAGPINVLDEKFYIFVDREYAAAGGYADVSIARRRGEQAHTISHSIFPPDTLIFVDKEPLPILDCAHLCKE